MSKNKKKKPEKNGLILSLVSAGLALVAVFMFFLPFLTSSYSNSGVSGFTFAFALADDDHGHGVSFGPFMVFFLLVVMIISSLVTAYYRTSILKYANIVMGVTVTVLALLTSVFIGDGHHHEYTQYVLGYGAIIVAVFGLLVAGTNVFSLFLSRKK